MMILQKLHWDQHLKSFLVVTIIWHSLIVSQWPQWLTTSVGHAIVVMSTFPSLIRHRGHHDGSRMRSRKCLPFRSTWFHLWFSKRFVLSCHLCLLFSCYSLVFWVLIVPCVWLLGIYMFYLDRKSFTWTVSCSAYIYIYILLHMILINVYM